MNPKSGDFDFSYRHLLPGEESVILNPSHPFMRRTDRKTVIAANAFCEWWGCDENAKVQPLEQLRSVPPGHYHVHPEAQQGHHIQSVHAPGTSLTLRGHHDWPD
jgi:hypothetical protein